MVSFMEHSLLKCFPGVIHTPIKPGINLNPAREKKYNLFFKKYNGDLKISSPFFSVLIGSLCTGHWTGQHWAASDPHRENLNQHS